MLTSEPTIHASPLAVQNIRSVIAAYRTHISNPGSDPTTSSSKAEALRVAFLKTFAGLFQKRVEVELRPRGYYFIDARPGTLDIPLTKWLSRQPILVSLDEHRINPSDQNCLLQSGEIESLIHQTEAYLDKHYGEIV